MSEKILVEELKALKNASWMINEFSRFVAANCKTIPPSLIITMEDSLLPKVPSILSSVHWSARVIEVDWSYVNHRASQGANVRK